jgi:hypothetical protein
MPHDINNRANEKIMKYWESLKNGRNFPSESEIDPDAIADIWDACFLVSIDDVTRRLGYRYSYLGTDLIEAYGDDISNPDVAAKLVSSTNVSTSHKFDDVVATKKPVIDESEFVNLRGVHIRYRTCMLPLGIKDNEVAHIIGCMSWRVY